MGAPGGITGQNNRAPALVCENGALKGEKPQVLAPFSYGQVRLQWGVCARTDSSKFYFDCVIFDYVIDKPSYS